MLINRKHLNTIFFNLNLSIMMRLVILLSVALLCNIVTTGQSYTTESKSCGSCGKAVSSSSRVGMYCPHCNVRWGYENEKRSTTTTYKQPSYGSNTSGFTSSNVNLRESPSTRSTILAKIPAFTTVSIIRSSGAWYYVKYTSNPGLFEEDIYGYVYKSLLN